jgi:hypothetical protein
MKQFISKAMKGTGLNEPTLSLRLIPRAMFKELACMPILIKGPIADRAFATPGGTAIEAAEALISLPLSCF